MDDTSGFYKHEDGALFYGPNFVESPRYRLTRETRGSFDYPVEGWSWFDSRAEALAYFGIRDPEGGA